MTIRHVPRRVLVTGGSGFIGCNFVRYLLQHDPAVFVVNLDALTYAGNPANTRDVERDHPGRYAFVQGDICDATTVNAVLAEHDVDTVVNFAAESHVDRSIDGPARFLETNIIGTSILLEAARARWGGRQDVRFHHVSTDEVFGSLGPTGYFDESTAYDPSSPYSASKAAADHLVRAWHRTWKIPVTLSNCSNNYGPHQFPEKLIPLMIQKALAYEALPVYGDGKNVRDWLYVVDHCEAIDAVVRRAEVGQTYVIGGNNEAANIDIVHRLCDLLDELRPRHGAPARRSLVTFVADRPGHDRRYAIDATAIARDLGWHPRETFDSGLRRTVAWYLDNADWVADITGGTYRGERLGMRST